MRFVYAAICGLCLLTAGACGLLAVAAFASSPFASSAAPGWMLCAMAGAAGAWRCFDKLNGE